MKPSVVAVVATDQRPMELGRLLASLKGVDRVVVCDNGGSGDIRRLVLSTGGEYLSPGENLGCGGGLRLAEQHVWKTASSTFTYLLVLDDDAMLKPDSVPRLIEVMEREKADAAYPLVIGLDGQTGWLPGLKDPILHARGKVSQRPDEYLRKLGAPVVDFDWAQGICLLARRAAVEAAGFHRGDFWVRGEDLDFSLRLTMNGRGIFVPDVTVQHLPPQPLTATDREGEYLRHAALVQNIAYLGWRQPHGQRIRHTILPAAARFLRSWGVGGTLDLLRAFWRGAIQNEPAGAGCGRTFRARYASR